MLFLIDTVDTASYVDNNTLCNIEKKQYEVEKKIEISSAKILE